MRQISTTDRIKRGINTSNGEKKKMSANETDSDFDDWGRGVKSGIKIHDVLGGRGGRWQQARLRNNLRRERIQERGRVRVIGKERNQWGKHAQPGSKLRSQRALLSTDKRIKKRGGRGETNSGTDGKTVRVEQKRSGEGYLDKPAVVTVVKKKIRSQRPQQQRRRDWALRSGHVRGGCHPNAMARGGDRLYILSMASMGLMNFQSNCSDKDSRKKDGERRK